MANGPFSKGGGTPLTPAQVQLQQAALQGSEDSSKIWQPVQTFFANQVQREAPGLKSMARGSAAAGGREAGSQQLQAGLSMDSDRGASAGSGAFLSDMAKNSAASAGISGVGVTDASGAADAHYAKGLQDVLGMYQGAQRTALGGLNTAANAQAQEAGAQTTANAQTMQGVGQVAGLVAAVA